MADTEEGLAVVRLAAAGVEWYAVVIRLVAAVEWKAVGRFVAAASPFVAVPGCAAYKAENTKNN